MVLETSEPTTPTVVRAKVIVGGGVVVVVVEWREPDLELGRGSEVTDWDKRKMSIS